MTLAEAVFFTSYLCVKFAAFLQNLPLRINSDVKFAAFCKICHADVLSSKF